MIGPQGVNGAWGVNSGRISAVVVDPRDAKTVYAAAAQGGVWKTTDGGDTWTPLTDPAPSLATGAIALDPQNPDTVYVGTGEETSSDDSYYGSGLLKSTDGGATWTAIPGTFAGSGGFISSVAVHPSNAKVLLLAAGSGPSGCPGVFESTDGGMTWTNVLNLSVRADNVLFDPENGRNAYASLEGKGIYRSSDGGATWSAANGSGGTSLPASGFGRVFLTIDPNDHLTLYAALADSVTGALSGLFRSNDGAITWSRLPTVPNFCGQQCWYTMAVAIAPGQPNIIFAGGDSASPVARSLDGGLTWSTYPSIHPNLHALAYSTDGSRLYLGSDGGMWSTTDISNSEVNFTSLNQTLATLQYYPGLAISPADINLAFGGAQDNGTDRYAGRSSWSTVDCGDGGASIIDSSTAPPTVYTNCTGATLDKSTDGGLSFSSANTGIDAADRVQWVPPITMDPDSPQTLYFGTQFVYRTTNGALRWTPISPDLTTGGTHSLTAIAVSPADTNTIYAGADDGSVSVTHTASAPTPRWFGITGTLPSRVVTAITSSGSSASTAYATFSGFSSGSDAQGHIFYTENGGVSWKDMSGNLPNVPVNDVAIDPSAADTVYVGTDLGVFYTTNNGISWAVLSPRLPFVSVESLKLHAATRTLRAATHGRSMWDISVVSVNPTPGITSISPTNALIGSADFILTVNGTNFAPASVVQWNGTDLPTTFVSSTQLQAAVPSSNVSAIGSAHVCVLVPGPQGNASNALTFSTRNPIPVVTAISPPSQLVGGGTLTLTITGSNFIPGSILAWNTTARATTYVSPTQLTTVLNSSDLSTGGTATVTVSNAGPGGGTSAALTFAISNPVPVIASLQPGNGTAGAGIAALVINGSNFVKGAQVFWNGAPHPTWFGSSTKLMAVTTPDDFAKAATVNIHVVNPGPGGGDSNTVVYAINWPRPALIGLSLANKSAGGVSAFTLIVTGMNFVPVSVVTWNGSPRTTTYVSPTTVTAQLNPADLAGGSSARVTVVNPAPGGGTSGQKIFGAHSPLRPISAPSR
jgi:photosystem II stability/assembly factor-like uncharacterized protein